MFQSTRYKLTAWYLSIIMLISIMFSVVIFGMVSKQIEGFIRMQNDRIQRFQNAPSAMNEFRPPPGAPPVISTLELQNQKQELLYTLITINLGILAVAGMSGYFLSGKTLSPIKIMMDEQNQFVSNASHELRTPIATLRAQMEGNLMEKHISDTQARTLIKSNLEELDTLQNLSDELLKLNQGQVMGGRKKVMKISISDILKIAVKRMRPLALKRNISLKMEAADAIVEGNKEDLVELMIILLDNAVKYSPKDTSVIITSEKNSGSIRISIADEGIGIAESDLPHIFERFYRADKSRSLTEGYGLGLSIAKKIVEVHSGSISIEQNKNKGTVFTVVLPNSLKK